MSVKFILTRTKTGKENAVVHLTRGRAKAFIQVLVKDYIRALAEGLTPAPAKGIIRARLVGGEMFPLSSLRKIG